MLKEQLILGCRSTSSETKSSSTAVSATEAASETSPADTDGDDEPLAGWELEAFGTWRTLGDTESAQIEKAYCDPNNDTVSLSVVVCMLQLTLLVKEFLKLVHFWRSYRQNGLITSHALFEVHCEAEQCMANRASCEAVKQNDNSLLKQDHHTLNV